MNNDNIEILEELINDYRNCGLDDFPESVLDFGLNKSQIIAIKNLIQENKELKEHLQKYYNGELYTAKQLKNIEENQRKYFIHKSKIKELLEHYKDTGYNELEEVLQQLLEEGE